MTQKMPKLIALSGWKGSGKDTTAHYLVNQYGYKQLSFAARLKQMVADMYGVDRGDLDSPTKKEMPLVHLPVIPTDKFTLAIQSLLESELSSGYWTPRALCILEGSIKRSVNSNYWVRSVADIIMSSEDGSNYVVSDMRYQSEADVLKILIPDTKTIRVQRFNSISTNDPSERDLDDYKFDYYVNNHGTMELLFDQLDSIIDFSVLGIRNSSR